MSSFSGVTFLAHTSAPSAFPDWEEAPIVTENQVAGTSNAIWQFMGRRPPSLEVDVKIANPTDYDTLRGLAGTQGTLVYRGTSIPNAILSGVGQAIRYARNVNANQEVVCHLTFRRPA